MKTKNLYYFLFLIVAFVHPLCSYGEDKKKLPPREQIEAFMGEELQCGRYVFGPGKFPEIRWKYPSRVESELGPFPLKVTYYDAEMNQVSSAGKPGRYGAVIEGITSSGFTVQRYITLFCAPVEFDDYSRNTPIKMQKLKDYGISDKRWNLYDNNEQRFSFGSMKYFPQNDPDAAIFLAGLAEIDSGADISQTPRLADRQWWITFKRTKSTKQFPKGILVPPKINDTNTSPIINSGQPISSELTKEHRERIQKVCRQWNEKSGEPMVALIVHRGSVILHEGFGLKADEQPLGTESPFWMASITKLLTGVLMMQFVDQGLVELDAPISRYLPELSEINDTLLIVRHCFTHTTGLGRAGEWASDWNTALENQIAHILPGIHIGETFSYNRVGYAIAGKIMERITGIAVPYLFQKNIFAPLGMTSAYADNTYGGLYCSAIDLARLGQMLLNRGTYNGYRFFSEKTFEQILPRKLEKTHRYWGIGTSRMEGHGLSESSFGHAAASGALFRIDPKNNLILISARNSVGSSNHIQTEYEDLFIEACTASFHE
jgi:CubicO group peptidase (beta-lactamase class C family)